MALCNIWLKFARHEFPTLIYYFLQAAKCLFCKFRLVEPLVRCIKSTIVDYCPNYEAMISDYLEPLGSRYCTNVGTEQQTEFKSAVRDG